jgi:TorA maturation chaperone TorD
MEEAPGMGGRERSEFFLSLSRAFATPDEPSRFEALRDYLADDLAGLATALGYPVLEAIDGFRQALGGVSDHLQLLRTYAALFVTPPVPVHLNAAVYLDRALLGGSELEMQRWYRRHGLVRAEGFHDLSDHVTVQLEFVGFLFADAETRAAAGDAAVSASRSAEARDFLATYPRRWLAPFAAAIERVVRSRELGWPYLHLARVLHGAIDVEARSAKNRSSAGRCVAARAAIPPKVPTAEDLARMAIRLAAHGISNEHLRRRPEWREDVYRSVTTPAA